MNEELKIIIKAITDDARKELGKVKGELDGLEKGGAKASKGFGDAMKKIAKVGGVAAVAVVAAIGAIIAGLTNLGKNSIEFQKEQAKLNTAFQAAGFSATQASKSYGEFYRFLGDSGKATEAAAHVAKLANSTEGASEWAKICQGVYASFGDSLPIEGLTEAANETARVGKVTGNMADALNWAGISEDAMNEKLATTNSLAEREKILRESLTGVYAEAAEIYEKNNKALLDYNESQARADTAMANAGRAVTPLLTALNNLSASFFDALAPAINAIIPYIAAFVEMIAKAITAVATFFGLLSGGNGAAQKIADSMSNAATGANNVASGAESAAGAAEKLKRSTQGFDELNKVSSNSSGGGGGGGASTPGYATGGGVVDTSGLTGALDESSGKVSAFLEKMKGYASQIKELFQPSIDAWGEAFNSIDWETIGANFMAGFENIKNTFLTFSGYVLGEFTPNLINSFSTNLLPAYTDVFNWILVEGSKAFEDLTAAVDTVVNDILIPILEDIEKMTTELFEDVKKNWDKYGKPVLEGLSEAIAGVKKTLKEFYDNVLKPVIDYLKEKVMTLWEEKIRPMWKQILDAIGSIVENLLILWNKVLKPIVDWILAHLWPKIKNVCMFIIDIFGDVIGGISGAISGIMKTLKGIIQFITGVFTGDWKKAWEGIKNIFGGVWDSIKSLFKAPVNVIISGINFLLRGVKEGVNSAIKTINKLSFTVPDWVPGIGGKKFGFNLKEISIKEIPKLARGGIVDSATLAMIGERGKEAVLPLENNTGWMDTLADKIANRNSAPSKIVLMLDGRELGWASINSINGITKQTGNLQLALG